MKIFRKLTAAAVVSSLLVTASMAAGIGSVTAPSGLNIRLDPSTDSAILGCAAYNSSISVIDKYDSEWYKVSYNGGIGYMFAEYLEVTDTAAAESAASDASGESAIVVSGSEDTGLAEYGAVTGDGVRIRSDSNLQSDILGHCNRGARVSLLALEGDWYYISYGSITGYMSAQYIRELNSTESSTAEGQSIVDMALSYLGVPYVYGGTSSSGFDCSGLVYHVFGNHGYSLYRGAEDQWNNGYSVDMAELQAGDLVFFSSDYSTSIEHVGIYIGDGQFVHASSGGDCVKINNLSDYYYSTYYYGAVRVLG